jgi:hypothetical protein
VADESMKGRKFCMKLLSGSIIIRLAIKVSRGPSFPTNESTAVLLVPAKFLTAQTKARVDIMWVSDFLQSILGLCLSLSPF